jgi:hypothetical protein
MTEQEFANADLAAVTSLLAQLTDEDVMTRFSLQARLEELTQTVQELGPSAAYTPASAALFFGGRPVIGSRGIESEFGGSAITMFQDLVAKVMAHDAGALGQRGVVPNKGASTLHITNILRGSFGFYMEEVQSQQPLFGTPPLKMAIAQTTRLLDAFGEVDEEQFQTAVEAVDERVINTARDFFELMRENGATLRLVAGDSDKNFGLTEIIRAADRAISTKVEETEEIIRGQLRGVLPDAHQFEFRIHDTEGTIHGKVDRVYSVEQLIQFNRELVNINSSAKVLTKRVKRSGATVRESFTILTLEPDDNAK